MFLEALPEIFRVGEAHLIRYLSHWQSGFRHKIFRTLHTYMAYEIVRCHVCDALYACVECRASDVQAVCEVVNLQVRIVEMLLDIFQDTVHRLLVLVDYLRLLQKEAHLPCFRLLRSLLLYLHFLAPHIIVYGVCYGSGNEDEHD